MNKNIPLSSSSIKQQTKQVSRIGLSLIISSPPSIYSVDLPQKSLNNYLRDKPIFKQVVSPKLAVAKQVQNANQFSINIPQNLKTLKPLIIQDRFPKKIMPYNKNINPQHLNSLKKNNSENLPKNMQKYILFNQEDTVLKESSFKTNKEYLNSYKSQKILPSFLKKNISSPNRSKPNLKKPLSIQNFKLIRRLGQGKFGIVHLAKQIYTGMIVALKIFDKQKIINDGFLLQFIRELKIQTFLNHPNIIKAFGFFSDQKHFYTVLQLGSDGQLYDLICSGQALSDQRTSSIIGNLLDAISVMHEYKILHRDIKPENIVLTYGNAKLCDFGWAVNKKDELRRTFCGTPLYLSPELLLGECYDEKVDLWALGILAYQLHIGSLPFQINQRQDLSKIITEDITFPTNRRVSKEFKTFIQAVLKKNPKERLSSKDLLALDFIQKNRQLQICQQL